MGAGGSKHTIQRVDEVKGAWEGVEGVQGLGLVILLSRSVECREQSVVFQHVCAATDLSQHTSPFSTPLSLC